MLIFWCCHTLLRHLPLLSHGSAVSCPVVREIGHLEPAAVQSSPVGLMIYQAAAFQVIGDHWRASCCCGDMGFLQSLCGQEGATFPVATASFGYSKAGRRSVPNRLPWGVNVELAQHPVSAYRDVLCMWNMLRPALPACDVPKNGRGCLGPVCPRCCFSPVPPC